VLEGIIIHSWRYYRLWSILYCIYL